MILYVPFLAVSGSGPHVAQAYPFRQNLFVITPLNWDEWKAVLYISLPIILLDEALKAISQIWVAPPSKIKKD
jgi:Ca2+ transporting ATPase